MATTAALLALTVAGCTPAGTDGDTTTSSSRSTVPTLPTVPYAPTTSSTSGTPAAADYPRLLLTAGDLTDAEDTFVERSREAQPNGSDGASAFFVNGEDSRAVIDTFLVYPDAATARATLKQVVGTLPTLVIGGTPQPLAIGTDGVVVSGTDPKAAKAVTLALFAQGRALVRLEFQSAVGDPTTNQFVTTIAKMQQIALRAGLEDK